MNKKNIKAFEINIDRCLKYIKDSDENYFDTCEESLPEDIKNIYFETFFGFIDESTNGKLSTEKINEKVNEIINNSSLEIKFSYEDDEIEETKWSYKTEDIYYDKAEKILNQNISINFELNKNLVEIEEKDLEYFIDNIKSELSLASNTYEINYEKLIKKTMPSKKIMKP